MRCSRLSSIEPAIETLTTCGGLTLVAQPFWSTRSATERRAAPAAHTAPAGLDKAPQFVLLNAMDGDGRENFRRLVEDPGLPRC